MSMPVNLQSWLPLADLVRDLLMGQFRLCCGCVAGHRHLEHHECRGRDGIRAVEAITLREMNEHPLMTPGGAE
jgi:hypothetical protein